MSTPTEMPYRAGKATGRKIKEESVPNSLKKKPKFGLVLDKSLLVEVRNNNYHFNMKKILKPQKTVSMGKYFSLQHL